MVDLNKTKKYLPTKTENIIFQTVELLYFSKTFYRTFDFDFCKNLRGTCSQPLPKFNFIYTQCNMKVLTTQKILRCEYNLPQIKVLNKSIFNLNKHE